MAANQFYPFATGGGAYVLSNAAYLALAARSSGYPAGLLTKENLNTPIRQAAFVAAVIGQYVADYGLVPANDDGVVANLEAGLVTANTNLTTTVVTGLLAVALPPFLIQNAGIV